MVRFFYILLLLVAFGSSVQAQELNCNVNIDASNVQLTAGDKTLLADLKTAITNFMNNRRWTEDVYSPEEKIKCNIYLTVKSVPAYGVFEATASVQSSRPIYGSTYESTLLNYFDKNFHFEYNPSQPFDFNENAFFTNLTSMLGFYAYIIIGMDYDSFSKLGGTPYFEKARNIASIAEHSQVGWTQAESTNNRYWLIADLNNQQMIPLREGIYTYHRLAMDQFIKNPEQSRKEIYEMVSKIKLVTQYNPYSILVKSFFLAKMNELVKIFSEASSDLKPKAVELFRQLDPLNSEKYSQITNTR